jgi:hypothetical protein
MTARFLASAAPARQGPPTDLNVQLVMLDDVGVVWFGR